MPNRVRNKSFGTSGFRRGDYFTRYDGQQVPKPPAPEPGVPPGNIPPLPAPDIPVPDPARPPIENPGDAPLPPITDPEVIEPGEPNPVRPPMRLRNLLSASLAVPAAITLALLA